MTNDKMGLLDWPGWFIYIFHFHFVIFLYFRIEDGKEEEQVEKPSSRMLSILEKK